VHFKSRGWFERLFYYVQDEPPVSDFPKVRALAALAHRADPQLRVLTTTPLDPRLGGEIDIWAPLVNCFEKKPGYAGFCRITVSREEYDKAGGGQVWWYQSCGSHGCGDTDDGYFRGWPSYVIDAPAIAHRIMQWLTWNYRIGGELYYSMNEAYQRRVDPFTDVYMHGGNGDGTLFYPGRPGQIGGRTPIPIESVRLKLIREGLEDYEYLGMLQAMGRTDFARERVQRLAGRTYAWEGDPEIFYSVRRELGEELEQMNGGVQ
jgi:hypothetical protein